MKKMQWGKLLSLVVCLVLIAAMALFTVGCSKQDDTEQPNEPGTTQQDGTTVLGEGETTFLFTVVDGEGKETKFEIHTDEKMVGVALQNVGLIEGEPGPYGLYVMTVNGQTYSYEEDGKYWAFYVNDEYATLSADQTEITAGDQYTFKVE